MQYVAKFYKDDDGIGVEFPDVPGAYTCADSLDEAMNMAKEALNGVLRSMLERHDPLPVAKTKPNVEKKLIPIDVDDGLAIEYSIYEARRGKSAASVARSMGISRQSFQHFENAKLSMSIANLIKIASALNKHVEIQLVDNYDYSVLRRNINESRKYKSTRSSRVREEDLVEV